MDALVLCLCSRSVHAVFTFVYVLFYDMSAGAYQVQHAKTCGADIEAAISDELKHAPHRRGGDKYQVNAMVFVSLLFLGLQV